MARIPFRLLVKQRLGDRLKTITPANGYTNDLSDFDQDGVTIERVYRGRTEFGDNDPLPFVSINEDPRVLEQVTGSAGSTSRAGEWELILQGFVPDDELNPTDPAQYLAAEVAEVIAAEMKRGENYFDLGDRKPCVTGIKMGAPFCGPADGEISDVAFFLMKVTLTLSEDLAEPFIST